MEQKLRKTGIDLIGDVPWGTHFCQFYQTKKDLVDILVPYFKAGLENNEFCVWVTSQPLSEKDAKKALRKAVPNIDHYLKKGQIEIIPYTDWYIIGGSFDSQRVLNGWIEKHDRALAAGYDGLRLTGNTFWLEKEDWKDFVSYEEEIDRIIGTYRMIAMCTYSLEKCRSAEVIDVVNNHEFALTKREGKWELVESLKRKSALEALRKSEERLKHVLDAGEFGIWELDVRTGKAWRSPRHDQIFGYQDLLPEWTYRMFLDHVLPEDRNEVDEKFARSILSRSEWDIACRISRADGQVRWVWMQGKPRMNDRDEVIKMTGLVRDITEHKRVEEALRGSEIRLNRAQEIAHLGSWELDLVNNRLSWSDEVYRIFGLQPQEFGATYEAFLEAVHPDDRGAVDAAYSDSLREGRDTYEIEHKVVRKSNGEIRIVHEKCEHIRDGSSGIIRSIGMVHDITERKQTEEALQQQREWLHVTLTSIGDAVLACDTDGLITFLNTVASSLTGWQPEEAKGQPMSSVFKIINEKTRQEAEDLVERVLHEKGVIVLANHTVLVTKDGREVPIEDSAAPILDTAGNVTGVVLVFHDVTEKRRTQEVLQESEARYRSLIELSPSAIFVNRNNRIVLLNPAAMELFGADSQEQILGKSPLDVFHPDSHAVVDERIHKLLQGQTVPLNEEKIVQMDGTVRDVEVTAAPMVDREGQAIQVILHDITERKKREDELKKLNRTLKALSDSSQAMMRATNESRFLQEICRIIEEDCGYSMVWIGYADEDEKKTVRPVAYAGFDEGYVQKLYLTWADTERGRGPTGTAIRTGKVSGCRNMLTDPLFMPWREEALKRGYASSLALPLMAGDKRLGAITIYAREPDAFLEDEIALLSELAGDLAYGISAVRLSVAHAHAVESLRKSEQQYSSLFNAMTEGFALHEIICDTRGKPCDYRFLGINPAFERLTGLKRGEVVGRTVKEVLPDNDPYWVEMYGKVALTGESVHFDHYSLALSRHYEVFAYSPAPREFAVVFRDITQRKQAEDELLKYRNHLEELVRERTVELETRNKELEGEIAERKRAEQEKKSLENQLAQVQKIEALGRFAGGIAHDLNNILYPIIINTEMLLEETVQDTSFHQTLKEVLNAAYRQRDLVKQILSFSRRSEQQFNPIHIKPLVKETLTLLRSSLPSTIEIRQHIDADTDSIMGDSTQIQQIIMNLCRNAADALKLQTGAIEVDLVNTFLEQNSAHPEIKAGEYLQLMVKDTGSGMAPKVMDHIFEPFFTTKEVGKGSGMGLAVVHGIVKDHGGSIMVESEPGKGSQFIVCLPVTDEKFHAQRRDSEKAVSTGGKGRILLIDDEEIILSSLKKALNRLGYTVVAVKDGREAFDMFCKTPDAFDLAITDLTMPGMTGVELSTKIIEIRPDIPIILCTGFSDVINEQEAKSIGIRELLVKPASTSELKTAINRVLEK